MLGAFEQRAMIIMRAVKWEPYPMPPEPREPLSATEMAILEAWVEAGAPEHAGDTGA